MQKKGEDISDIYISLNPYEEIDESEKYEMHIVGSVPTEIISDWKRRTKADGAVTKVAEFLNSCDGIEVIDCYTRAENKISIDDLKYMKIWNFDYITLRKK